LGKGFAKTTIKTSPKFELIKRNAITLASKPYVKIGILEGKAEQPKEDSGETQDESKLTLVDVATFHEFGTVNIPERSFLRGTIDANKAQLQSQTAALFRKVSSGEIEALKAIGILGLAIKSMVQKRIRTRIEPALDEKTIKRKGSSKALIDTGQLINSIQHKVESKG